MEYTVFAAPLLIALALAPSQGRAGVIVGLHAEAPTVHSPMARYSGESVEHRLPISVGARAELGVPVGSERWLVTALGVRSSSLDLGRVEHAMLDLAFREALPGSERLHPYWEAGGGAELIRLRDHDGAQLALHLGPRFFGGLGLGLGAARLQPTVGLRAGFTAATGSFELSDVEQDDEVVERFYMPSVLVLAGTVGLRF
jgi:hypothetical protein